MNTMSFIIVSLSITVVPGVLFGIYWYFVTKKGWNSLGLFTLSVATLILIGTLIIWLFTRSTWLLAGGLLTTLLQIIAMLSWNITSPKVVKALKLRK